MTVAVVLEELILACLLELENHASDVWEICRSVVGSIPRFFVRISESCGWWDNGLKYQKFDEFLFNKMCKIFINEVLLKKKKGS